MEPIYCRQCRAAISREATFCPVCGRDQRIIGDVPKETPQAAPPPTAPVQSAGLTEAQKHTINRVIIGFFGVVAVLMVSCFYAITRPISTARTSSPPPRSASEQTFEEAIQATPAPTPAPVVVSAPQESSDPFESAVGKINTGVTVYYRASPSDQADPWFTVLNPFVEGNDPEHPMMLVRYAATGREEYLDRRATMRSPAAQNGQLVIRRGGG